MLSEDQKQDLDTWDERATRPPFPFVTRFMSAEEYAYLEEMRLERRTPEQPAAAKARYSGPAPPG